MKLDHSLRKFTPTAPIHIDLYGGVVKILTFSGNTTLLGRKMPIIALRYQAGSDEVTEEYYTLDGGWDAYGEQSNHDLWDADLTSIRPMPRVKLEVVPDVA